MRNTIENERWLNAAQCARRLGLTVRALRLYEELGLIRPPRTGKNWRLYGPSEIARLNEVLTLKRLGLSLPLIADLLKGQVPDLARMLTVQMDILQDHRDRIQASLAQVAVLKAKVAAGNGLTLNELLDLAKDLNMTDSAHDTIAWRRYEQARPRIQQAIAPELYDDYVGFYQLGTLIFTIAHRDQRLFARLTGQPELEIFAEAADRFFCKAVLAQITFTRHESGAVSGLVLHQDGLEQVAPKVSASTASGLEEALAKRIEERRPLENSESLLRAIIDQHQRGEPDYERMTAPLALLAQEQASMIRSDLEQVGPLKTLTFKGVNEEGWDVYDVLFEKERLEWSFALASDGKLAGLFIRPAV